MRREDDISGKLDWYSIGLYLALITMGWVNIYAAVYFDGLSIFDISYNPGKQLMFIVISGVLILGIIVIDMRFYEAFAYVIFGVALFLLFLVPIIGKEVGGNKNWLGVGMFGIQPSEFAKVATALAIGKFIGSVGFRMDNMRSQASVFALMCAPIALIFLQKDFGTAMVFASFLVVFYREGMSPFLIIVGLCSAVIFILTLLISNQIYLHIGVAVVLVVVIFFGKRKIKRIVLLTAGAVMLSLVIESVDYVINNVLPQHHQNRLKALINPDSDPLGFGWNVTQSKIAIGSGGFFGKGFLEGTQTKFDFVPEQSTDFIFCTIGEEWGWVGSLMVIGLFVALLLRVIFIAERQKNRFARAYGYGVASIFFFHFAVNIAMTVGLFPVIGIPLPFFSYGGSSLLAFTILLFVLLKLDAHRSQVLQRI